MNSQKKGFTLVELSIVLVIIGLLIGGILAAQSLIGTAKIQGLVRQVAQFDAAVENFQTKYQQLPGDTNLMGLNPGDNNGIIAEYAQGNPNAGFRGELAKFWSDLSKSGLTNPNGTAYLDESNASLHPDNTMIPQSVFGDKALILACGINAGRNFYFISQINGTLQRIDNGLDPAFKAADVLAIDQKIDDGLANSGNVSGWDAGGFSTPPQYDIEAPTLRNCTNPPGGNVYSINVYTNTCSLRIRIGTSTSNLK